MIKSALVSHVPLLRSNDGDSRDNGHSPHGNFPRSGEQESEEDKHAHEDEKRFVSAWEDNKRPLSPAEVASDPEKKQVGHSSRHLRLDDFELIKTLGTGAHTQSLT
jgi:protein kinase A